MSAIEAERRRLQEEEERTRPERERLALEREEQLRKKREEQMREIALAQDRELARQAELAEKSRLKMERLRTVADTTFARAVDELENNDVIRTEVVQYVAKHLVCPSGGPLRERNVDLIRIGAPNGPFSSGDHYATSLVGRREGFEVNISDRDFLAKAFQRKTYDHRFVHPDLKGWGIRVVGNTSYWPMSWNEPYVKFVMYPVPWYSKWFE